MQTLPSHASMLTGLYPITQNLVSNGQRLDREMLTLPELLQADGYRTGAIVATSPLRAVFGLAQGFQTNDDDFEESFVSRGIKSFLNEIEFADHFLGAVLRELDALGLTGNTLTVFTADHGEAPGEQGYVGHREEVFESIIHVPLIVRMPGRVPVGKRLATPAQLVPSGRPAPLRRRSGTPS